MSNFVEYTFNNYEEPTWSNSDEHWAGLKLNIMLVNVNAEAERASLSICTCTDGDSSSMQGKMDFDSFSFLLSRRRIISQVPHLNKPSNFQTTMNIMMFLPHDNVYWSGTSILSLTHTMWVRKIYISEICSRRNEQWQEVWWWCNGSGNGGRNTIKTPPVLWAQMQMVPGDMYLTMQSLAILREKRVYKKQFKVCIIQLKVHTAHPSFLRRIQMVKNK